MPPRSCFDKTLFVPLPSLEWHGLQPASNNVPVRTIKKYKAMAKQLGSIRFRGKVGNVVGFTSSLSAKGGTQYVRAANESYTDPKSYKQATQRAKMSPAQIFYAAFESILNHAFLPAGKAARNRLAFLSLALKNPVIPSNFKGDAFIPYVVPYQVSKGSLGLDYLCEGAITPNGVVLGDGEVGKSVSFPNLFAGDALEDAFADFAQLTVGEFSRSILNANPALVEGEELTFMAVLCDEDNLHNTAPAHFSVVLNRTDDLTTMGDLVGSSSTKLFLAKNSDDGNVILANYNDGGTAYGVACAALIISSKSASSWKYTNSFVAISGWMTDGIDFDPEEVVRSYMGTDAQTTSDLILQQADNQNVSGIVAPVTGANIAFTPDGSHEGATYNHQSAAVVTMSDGTRRVVVMDGTNILAYYNGTGFERITETWSGQTSALGIEFTTWDGARTITATEAAAANFS